MFCQVYTTFALVLYFLGEKITNQQVELSADLKKKTLQFTEDDEIMEKILILSEKLQVKVIKPTCGVFDFNIQTFTQV
jgi:hypothetical protein